MSGIRSSSAGSTDDVNEADRGYQQRWEASTEQVIAKLSRFEQRRLREIKSAAEAEGCLQKLFGPQPCTTDNEAALVIKLAMTNVMSFLDLSITSLEIHLDTTVIWGFFGLIFTYAHKRKEKLCDVSTTFTSFGQRVEDLTALLRHWVPEGLARDLVLGAHTAILSFASGLACRLSQPGEARPEDLDSICDPALRKLDDITARAERRKRWESQHGEVERLRKLLEIAPITPSDDAMRSCVMLPPAANARFYDRDKIIESMDLHLRGEHTPPGFRMYGLYGLGGVGKTHVALKYAETKMMHFQTILWIHSATAQSLEQAFTDISIRLKLNGANRIRHEQNRIEVLNWLRETSCKWLLVYDNVENLDLFWKYRPATSHGCAIVTTRSRAIADRIAEARTEVVHFDTTSGSRFILHLLAEEVATDIGGLESESAMELSERLSGHALAISSVAALLRLRSWTVQEFLDRHDRNPKRAESVVQTVWQLSFSSLDARSSKVLAVLSYMMPDAIPHELFESPTTTGFPQSLRFCVDDWDLQEVIDNLINLALIRRDKITKAFSIHRLVQSQFRYFMSDNMTAGNQEAFDDATELLYARFPKVDEKGGQLFDRIQTCQLYAQHVSSLKNHFRAFMNTTERLKPGAFFCRLLHNYGRHLLESTSFEELEDTLQVSKVAYDLLQNEDKDKNILAKILDNTALMWAHRGSFSRCEADMARAHTIRCSMKHIDPSLLAWSYTNLANIVASLGRPEEALDLDLKSLRIREEHSQGDHAALGIAYQNISRSHCMLGSFAEAKYYAGRAIDLLSKAERWVMVAYTKFVLGNVFRAQNELRDAHREYGDAINIWMEHKNSPVHHFRAACAYKLGCTALDLGDDQDALMRLEEAHAIARIHRKVMPGDHARILVKLAEAKSRGTDAAKADACTMRKHAGNLLAARRTEAGLAPHIQGEAAYDRLVYILWR